MHNKGTSGQVWKTYVQRPLVESPAVWNRSCLRTLTMFLSHLIYPAFIFCRIHCFLSPLYLSVLSFGLSVIKTEWNLKYHCWYILIHINYRSYQFVVKNAVIFLNKSYVNSWKNGLLILFCQILWICKEYQCNNSYVGLYWVTADQYWCMHSGRKGLLIPMLLPDLGA